MSKKLVVLDYLKQSCKSIKQYIDSMLLKTISSVQEALSEIQKFGVPSGGRPGQALIKSTDADYETEWGGYVSNKNMLDNWYLMDPISQRGAKEYTAGTTKVYTVDRWYVLRGSIATSANGVSYSWDGINGDHAAFSELFDNSPWFGKTVTFSAIINGKMYTVTGKGNTVSPKNDNVIVEILDVGGYRGINIQNYSTEPVIIQAVKLELGPIQTLAHKEGDQWVLNDPPPNKALELVKCQRYYRPVNLACISVANSATEVTLYAARPADMRIAGPTFTDVTRAMTKTPMSWDTTTVANIKITYNNNYIQAVVSEMRSQIEGTVGFGYIKGAWNAEL